MTKPIDLDEAERIGKAAIAAPWIVNGCFIDAGKDMVCMEAKDETAEFIAYARNHWQALVDELRELREFPCESKSENYASHK